MNTRFAPGKGHGSPRITPVLLLLSLLLTPLFAGGQEITYTTVTRGEFGGTLGVVMNLAPGSSQESHETVYVKPPFTRTDSENSSTILDMERGIFTFLQHPSESYYTLSMADFTRQAEEMADEMAAARPEPAPETPTEEEESPRYRVELSTDRTGKTMSFDGYSAEEVLMTMEVIPVQEGAVEPAEDEAADPTLEGGRMVLLTQLWVSRDFPGWEAMQEAQGEMARELMKGEGAGLAQSMQQAFASDPRIEEGFRQSMEEMQGLEGMPVKTVTSFIMVPPGQEFQPDPILASLDEPLPTVNVGAAVADAAQESAKDAARNAVSNLTGGLFGGKKKEEEKPPEESQEEEPTQSVIMRVTSLVEDVRTDPIPNDLFQPPADYQETTPTELGRGG